MRVGGPWLARRMFTPPRHQLDGFPVASDDTGTPRVLIIDDDPSVCRAIGRGLRSGGIESFVASTLRDGIENLDRCDFALVDLDLPDGCGTDLLRTVRVNSRPVRVAVCSGRIDADAVVAASGEQPEAVFAKPVDLERLLAWVASPAASDSTAAAPPQPMKVNALIVDDHPDSCEILVRLLRKLHGPADCVDNGADAIRYVADRAPTIVFLDWMMPNMSGLEVLRALRADPRNDDVTVVMYSALTDPSVRAAALAAGAQAFVVKGHFDEIEAAVRTFRNPGPTAGHGNRGRRYLGVDTLS
jgi:DNA-binding response OmpR family regulator